MEGSQLKALGLGACWFANKTHAVVNNEIMVQMEIIGWDA